MESRKNLVAICGVVTDLLCLLAAAAILLTHNEWLMQVGAARFWFVVLVGGLGVVPMMLSVERAAAAHVVVASRKPKPSGPAAWAGADRSLMVS